MTDRDGVGFTLRQRTDLVAQVVGPDTVAIACRLVFFDRNALTHKEINIVEFARSIGMKVTLLRNYINGFKKPSDERESVILAHIHKLGKGNDSSMFLIIQVIISYRKDSTNS